MAVSAAGRLALGALLLAALLGCCRSIELVLSEQEEAFAASEAAAKASAKASDDPLKGKGPKGQDLNQKPLGTPSDKMTPEQKLIDWVIRDRGVVGPHAPRIYHGSRPIRLLSCHRRTGCPCPWAASLWPVPRASLRPAARAGQGRDQVQRGRRARPVRD
jgi:hypothetical protein